MRTVCVTRPYPGEMPIPDARIVVGPKEGLRERAAMHAFLREHSPHALVTMFHDPVDAEALDAAGEQLKVVCNFAVGYDNIDLDECERRGIVVCNTPDAVTEGTADIAFLLMLAAARRLKEADDYARSAEYPKNGYLGMDDFLGLHLSGRTLLIVGAGRIGYATALRGIGWGMRTLYVARSRHVEFEIAPLSAERVDLDEGLERADFVSVHTPLTKDTRHLIDERRLRLMKPTSVIVNTARGPVIEEAALVKALREEWIFGAGLDVYEFEPKPGAELIAQKRAILTPHIGSASRKHRELMTTMVGENVTAALEGRRPANRIR
jgi:glyoxylate reductase